MIGYLLLGVFAYIVIAALGRGFRLRDVSTIDGDESRDASRIGYGGGSEL